MENVGQVPAPGSPLSRLRRVIETIRRYRPPLNDANFWVIQGMVVVIAMAPLVFEPLLAPRWLPAQIFSLSMIFISLLIIPVMYAGVRYGAVGAVATTVVSTILSLPHAVLTDLIITKSTAELPAQLVQLALFVAVSLLVAQRIEQERRARADLRDYAARLVTRAEEERNRLSRELHDDVVQRMGILRLHLDALKPAVSG